MILSDKENFEILLKKVIEDHGLDYLIKKMVESGFVFVKSENGQDLYRHKDDPESFFTIRKENA